MNKPHMKYNPCCNRRCTLANCEIRDTGGCYCVCRINDAINQMKSIIDGTSVDFGQAVVYLPNRKRVPLQNEELKKALIKLKTLEETLKKYEITSDSTNNLENQ